ncbi:histidinol-phosphate aminotransferase [Immersiella caudata]|uniref:histidinol-phosphate transaminase n=1 Tax=Immersiella caudata TaxID=314043 RepID=A0AA39WE22_9PEZI|nr:histidinol-phosphate aminotransferase [Immersiella caudata]
MVRPNILSVGQFQTERCSIEDTANVLLLDLNESPFGPSIAWHGWPDAGQGCADLAETCLEAAPDQLADAREGLSRYPDVKQLELKQAFCAFRNCRNGTALTPANLCLSAGLDEMIDLIIRCICRPGRDRIVICPPVYHMYQTSAAINDVETIKIPLNTQNSFQLRLPELQQTLSSDPSIKICFICTPGNPTGHAIPIDDIISVLENPNWRGILVVDEAYIDFSPRSPSAAALVGLYPRLVVLQTLSKAFGLASIRVGFTFACPHLCAVLSNVRKPYAVSGPSLSLARVALGEPSLVLLDSQLQAIFDQRARLARDLDRIQGIRVKGGLDANFVLFVVLKLAGVNSEVGDHSMGRPCNVAAGELVRLLRESAGILVRFKGLEYGCEGGIRVSVGKGAENNRFVEQVSALMKRLRLRATAAAVDTTSMVSLSPMIGEPLGLLDLGAAA